MVDENTVVLQTMGSWCNARAHRMLAPENSRPTSDPKKSHETIPASTVSHEGAETPARGGNPVRLDSVAAVDAAQSLTVDRPSCIVPNQGFVRVDAVSGFR